MPKSKKVVVPEETAVKTVEIVAEVKEEAKQEAKEEVVVFDLGEHAQRCSKALKNKHFKATCEKAKKVREAQALRLKRTTIKAH